MNHVCKVLSLVLYMAASKILFVKGINILKLMLDAKLKSKYVNIEMATFTFNIK